MLAKYLNKSTYTTIYTDIQSHLRTEGCNHAPKAMTRQTPSAPTRYGKALILTYQVSDPRAILQSGCLLYIRSRPESIHQKTGFFLLFPPALALAMFRLCRPVHSASIAIDWLICSVSPTQLRPDSEAVRCIVRYALFCEPAPATSTSRPTTPRSLDWLI